jgi:DNA-binding CsgD family transcriptional regulator
MKTIGTAMLRERQGKTPQQISAELGLSPEQVKGLVIRAKAWELSR